MLKSELWIKNYKDNHPSCWESEGGILPTRLPDFEKDGERRSVVLIETNGMTGRYMTLCHCWGATHPLTTTTATIHERKHGILLSEIPRTSKDFIEVAKDLGMRYVWIDSLCIFQDDAADWASEAGKWCRFTAEAISTLPVHLPLGVRVVYFPPNRR